MAVGRSGGGAAMRDEERTAVTRVRPRPPGAPLHADVDAATARDTGEEMAALAAAIGDSAPSATLQRRAADALARLGRPADALELASAVFGVGGALPGAATPWIAMLERMLAASPVFARAETGTWHLAAWDAATQLLADVEFAVVDVETTGLALGRHHVIEVGAVLVRNGE